MPLPVTPALLALDAPPTPTPLSTTPVPLVTTHFQAPPTAPRAQQAVSVLTRQ